MGFGGYPLPALAVRPPESPLEQYGQVSNLASLAQRRQLLQGQAQLQQGDIQLQNQQIKDQQALTAAAKNWDGQDYDALSKSVLQNGGSANAALSVQQHALTVKKTVSDIAKADADTGAKNLDTFIGKHKAVGDALEGIEQVPDEQLHDKAISTINELAKSGVLDPQSATQLVQKVQATPDPASLRNQIDLFAKSSMGAKAVAEQQKVTTETGKEASQKALADAQLPGAQAESAIKGKELAAMQGGQAAGTSLDVQEANAWLKKNPGKDLADYGKYKATLVPAFNFNLQSGLLNGPPGISGVSPIDLPAMNYLQTGTMPTGMRSPAMSSAIIRRASELAQQHPELANLAANRASYEANKKSYDNVTGTLDTLTAFENTGLKNLKQFTDLAAKLPDTGVPWLNTPVRKLNQNLVGAEYMPAIEAARSVALREIARVTNDPKLKGSLTDSARQEVEGLSPENATLPQIKRVVEVLQNDMANVHSSLAQQKADIGQRLNIAPTSTQAGGAAAQPTAPQAQPQHVAGGQAQGLKEGATGTGSDGKKYIVKGGKWVAQ